MTITFRLTDLRRAALPLGVSFGHSPYGTSSRGRPWLDFFDLILFISHVSQCPRHPALTRRPVSIVGICVSRAYGYRAFGCIGLDFVTYPILGDFRQCGGYYSQAFTGRSGNGTAVLTTLWL